MEKWYLHKMNKEGSASEHRFVLPQDGIYYVGRSPDSGILLQEREVSRRHFALHLHEEKVSLRDLRSSNGTFINGGRIQPGSDQALQSNDYLGLGNPSHEGSATLILSKSGDGKNLTHVSKQGGVQNNLFIQNSSIRAEGGGQISISNDVREAKPFLVNQELVLNENSPFLVFNEIIDGGGQGVIRLLQHREKKSWYIGKCCRKPENGYKDKYKEAKLLQLVSHPNIVGFHSFVEHSVNMMMLVMDFINGTNLSDYLKKEGAIETRQAVTWVVKIADALQETHKSGVFHRDVKAGNIMIEEKSEECFLIDFGIASGEDINTLLTEGVSGTHGYMAPERANIMDEKIFEEGSDQEKRKRKREIDYNTDCYGLGVLLYALLTGDEQTNFKAQRKKETLSLGEEHFDPLLRRICQDQIIYQEEERCRSLHIFKARLQLWLILEEMEREENLSIPWKELSEKVLTSEKGEHKMDLEKLSLSLRQRIAQSAQDNPPPFWQGQEVSTENLVLSEEGKEAQIYWVPSPPEERGKILLEVQKQIVWENTVLQPAMAICAAGKEIEKISLAPTNALDPSYQDYLKGLQAEQEGQEEQAHKLYQAAQEAAPDRPWLAILTQQGQGLAHQKNITLLEEVGEDLEKFLDDWRKLEKGSQSE